MNGRTTIYTALDDLTLDNVIEEVESALLIHSQDVSEMNYLYWYHRGNQPILKREKQIRPDICNKIVENHAKEIVSFKNSWFLTQPIFYVPRHEEGTDKAKTLNEFIYRSGKAIADNKTVNWFHIVGKGIEYIEQRNDPVAPFKVYSIDPRNAFVVYSLSPSHEPVYSVNMAINGDDVIYDVFTKTRRFKLKGANNISHNEPISTFTVTQILPFNSELSVYEIPNPLGEIPMVEFFADSTHMGSFEAVMPLIDAINEIESNRVDSIAQFVQSLVVATNVEFPEGTTASAINESGLLSIKSIGQNQASIEILSQQLGQSETQVFVDYLYEQILNLCAMPSTTKGGTSTSDTGAAVLARDGYTQADMAAQNTEDCWRESNEYVDRIIQAIINVNTKFEIDIKDFELQFTRNETANIQSKAQACSTMLGMGMHPVLAFTKSGISNDAVADVEMSKPYLDQKQEYAQKEVAEDDVAV